MKYLFAITHINIECKIIDVAFAKGSWMKPQEPQQIYPYISFEASVKMIKIGKKILVW